MRTINIEKVIAMQKKIKNVRNISILAHVDHGKLNKKFYKCDRTNLNNSQFKSIVAYECQSQNCYDIKVSS